MLRNSSLYETYMNDSARQLHDYMALYGISNYAEMQDTSASSARRDVHPKKPSEESCVYCHDCRAFYRTVDIRATVIPVAVVALCDDCHASADELEKRLFVELAATRRREVEAAALSNSRESGAL